MHIKILVISLACCILFRCSNKKADPVSLKGTVSSDSSASWALLSFKKMDNVNPILIPGDGSFIDPILKKKVFWEVKDVFNPAVVNRNGKIYMLYRAQDKTGKPAGTSRIGLAVSNDAIHFSRMGVPVLYPENDAFKNLEWEGGCEDPRVVEDDKGVYYMYYTAFDGKTARLLVATSKDLVNWKKHGDVFATAYNGKYADKWSKSGSVVSTYKNDGKIVAARINGKYWMYWGDEQIWCATSGDLINWTPLEMKPGESPPVKLRDQALTMPLLKVVLPTRKGKFDSDLVESGPPAMLTDKGIILIYNSRNVPAYGDKSLPEGTYAASQVLFDRNDPTKIIHRMNTYFIKPERPYELSGQVNKVCFVEGLTLFKNNLFLYYGTADSKIALASTLK